MIGAHERVVIDLGTGSGQAVLRRARQYPHELVIGVDADAAAMADASRRAAAAAKRGGLPNALFLVAPAEELPGVLAGAADVMFVALPWGSLLRGILTADPRILRAIRASLRPDGELELLLSVTERDTRPGQALTSPADAATLAHRLGAAGLEVREWRPADESDVARLSSAWAKRLGIPARRPAWVYRLRPALRERTEAPPRPADARRRRGCTGRAGVPGARVTANGD